MKKTVKNVFYCLFFLAFSSSSAVVIEKTNLPEDDYILFSVRLNDDVINNSIDTFLINGQLFFSIEPLLSALKLRYQLTESSLLIWKNDTVHEYTLSEKLGGNSASIVNDSTLAWGDDGFYAYISETLINQLFATTITSDIRTLQVDIATSDYIFPFQILLQQEELRLREQRSGYDRKGGNNIDKKAPIQITIPDQYRLATMPSGTVTASTEKTDDNKDKGNVHASFVADLLYHSAIVNLDKSNSSPLKGGMVLSRYKTSPDELVLGMFDHYSFGDIGSTGLTTSLSQSGLGILFNRQHKNYRSQNTVITLSEYVTPGWEAELYHNNRFLSKTDVPETGLLLYNDLEVRYGQNVFIIKLYGPFGEKEEIKRTYRIVENLLGENEFSYGVHALDPNKSVFNSSENAAAFNLSNIGGNIDYGVNDTWQIGLSYTHQEVNEAQELVNKTDVIQDAITLRNSISLPGTLFENILSANDNGGFFQQSSLLGNAIFDGNFSLSYKSSKDYINNNNTGAGVTNYDNFLASYNNILNNTPINFSFDHRKTEDTNRWSLNNQISYVYDRLYLGHNISYSSIKSDSLERDITSLTGSVSLAGTLYKDLRISSNINYDPERSSPILKSSNIGLNYSVVDPFEFRHYMVMQYRPLQDLNKWSFTHNLGINVDQYRFGIVSRYQDGDKWNVSANIQFFFGYDYHNQRALFNSRLNQSSAQLNLHAYLDRQINGVYDALDYNLEGVTIPNISAWDKLPTGEGGRAIIPGVPVNTPFSFNAEWKSGAQTVTNNYVLYTHPGARVDVNMPFYLSTELSGFVSLLRREEEVSARNLTIELLGSGDELIASAVTDEDGYYEFDNIEPANYFIRVSTENLREYGFSSEVVGFKISSASIGGYIGLPTIFLHKTNTIMQEKIEIMAIDSDDFEQLIWDDDEHKMKNYFNMPTKNKIDVDPNLTSPVNNDGANSTGNAELMNREIISADKQSKLSKLTKNNTVKFEQKKTVKEMPEKSGFIIQLGAFSSLEAAEIFKRNLERELGVSLLLKESKNRKDQTFYRIQFGGYLTKFEAENSAKNLGLQPLQYMIKQASITHLPTPSLTTVVTPIALAFDAEFSSTKQKNGWVIQYAAFTAEASVNEYMLEENILNAFVAQKMLNKKNDIRYFCLISKVFMTKDAALAHLNGRSGWVLPSTTFTKVTQL